MKPVIAFTFAAAMLAGCANDTPVMDAGNGTYLISANASAARGGAAGASEIAFDDANKYCATKGSHAVVIDTGDRDVYSRGFAAGHADLHFRCAN